MRRERDVEITDQAAETADNLRVFRHAERPNRQPAWDQRRVGAAARAEPTANEILDFAWIDPPHGETKAEPLRTVRELHDLIGNVILGGYDWRGALAAKSPRPHLDAVLGALEYLRRPRLPDDPLAEGDQDLTRKFRTEAGRLARFYALCSTRIDLKDYRDDIAFFENVRVHLAKFEAEERRERGLLVPAEVELYLRQLTASSIEAGGVTDVYAAAGVGRPDVSQLDEAFIARMQREQHPHLVIEALRRLVEEQKRKVVRHNIVRQQSFSGLEHRQPCGCTCGGCTCAPPAPTRSRITSAAP
jgi:hypothetical protein